jgi:hypothetical protein
MNRDSARMRRAALVCALAGAAAIAIGIFLATRQRPDISGCNDLGPCDPSMGLPYLIPGAVAFVAGVAAEVGAAVTGLAALWISVRRQ